MGLILGMIIGGCLFTLIYSCMLVSGEESRKEEDDGKERNG